MNLNRIYGTFIGILLAAASMAQSDPYARAADVMSKLELSSEWSPTEMVREDTGGGRTLTSPHLRLTFFGGNNKLMTMRWTKRLDEIRARGEFQGAYFSSEAAVRQRAETIAGRLGLGDGWRVQEVLGGEFGLHRGLQEYAGGAISVRFEFTINGLRDTAKGADIMFDSSDGKVASVSIMNPGTGFTYVEPTNLITVQAAEAKARAHVTAWLRGNTPAEYSEQLINRFPIPSETRVILSYGGMDQGFDSKAETYRSGNKRYPIYSVYYGDLVVVHILATNGDCVGGAVYKSAADTPVTSNPLRARDGADGRVPTQPTGHKPGGTTESRDEGTAIREPAPRGPLSLVLSGVLGIAVVGAGVAMYLKRAR